MRLRRSTANDRRSLKDLVSLRKFARDEQGVAALEYVLIVTVALVLVVALVVLMHQGSVFLLDRHLVITLCML